MVDTITTKVYRQIKQLQLQYDHDTVAILPKKLSVLDVIVMPDARDKLNVPYLIYLYEGGEEEEKTLRVISGQAELDYRFESPRFLGSIPQRKRYHQNFATVWLITKKKAHPDNQPKVEPPAKKKPPKDPESVKAREAAERAAQEKAEFEARLAEAGT
jgi:hypothetical protein